MILGAHVVLFSDDDDDDDDDADADRTFLAEVLGFDSIDAGGGWLVFGLPPAEVAVHPADAPGCALYLMCRDLDAELERLRARGVECSEVEEARWGAISMIRLPGGGQVGLYQPRHPTTVGLTMVEGP